MDNITVREQMAEMFNKAIKGAELQDMIRNNNSNSKSFPRLDNINSADQAARAVEQYHRELEMSYREQRLMESIKKQQEAQDYYKSVAGIPADKLNGTKSSIYIQDEAGQYPKMPKQGGLFEQIRQSNVTHYDKLNMQTLQEVLESMNKTAGSYTIATVDDQYQTANVKIKISHPDIFFTTINTAFHE
jgi:hypothetical protein